MASSCGLRRPILLVLWAAALITVVCGHSVSHATLPIFQLHPEPSSKHRAIELAKELYNISHFKLTYEDSRIVLRSKTHRIEVDTVNNGIWTADESRMWNHTIRPCLLNNTDARKIADKIIKKHHLIPNDTTSPFTLKFHGYGATHLAVQSNDTRTNHTLDTRVIYTASIDLPGQPGVQVVGGGGKFQVVLGDNGRLIGFHGVWRSVDRKPFHATVIPQKKADATFLKMTKHMKLVEYNSSLAYYSAPAFSEQKFLYPVYIYQGTAIMHGQHVPMRIMTLPATDFGPHLDFPAPLPMTRSHPTHHTTATQVARSSPVKREVFEFGTSWIGTSQGLAGSQANAQGFVDELTADGWHSRFNWGDANAWESDWNRNDDSYVDAVDFVFYTGHANSNGWVLSPPDDGFLEFTEVRGRRDRWGKQDCEWIVVAACGPLQDDLATGGGSVFNRWVDAFDGLHILLGYAGITYDNTEEGRRLVQYAKGGAPLIDAWFRTAQEIQPTNNGAAPPDGPTIFAGAVWRGPDTRSDHIWGHGPVSADPPPGPSPGVFFSALWTMC